MTLHSQLTQLENAQLVRRLIDPSTGSGELAYLFKHALVQETAYESLLKHERKRLHRAVAETLERSYPNELDANAARLAQHYAEAGDDAKTLEYATRAGDSAARIYANTEAVASYALALQTALHGDVAITSEQLAHLFVSRGRALEVSGDYPQAFDNYEQMRMVARQRHDRALELAALVQLATVRATPNSMSNAQEGERLAEEGLALARELGDRAAEAKILWTLLLNRAYTGQLNAAVEYGERSLALARELNLREQLAFTLNDLATYGYASNKQNALAHEALAEARALWQELGNMPMYSDNLNQSAFFNYVEGDLKEAFTLAQEGYRIAVAIGSPWGQVFGLTLQGVINLEWGEYDQARQNLDEAIRLGKDGAFRGGSGIAGIYLTLMYLDLGAVEQAFEAASFAQEAVQVLPIFVPSAFAALACALLRQGDLAAAVETLEQARALTAKMTIFTFLPLIVAEGEVGLAQENYDGVVATMDDLLRQMEARSLRSFRADALYYKGRALFARGELDRAGELIVQARDQALELGSRRSLWRILGVLWEIETARNNPTGSEEARSQARQVIEYIAAHAPADPSTALGTSLRETFLNLPEVRTLGVEAN